MEIKYTQDKIFTMEQVESLFLSVGWVSGQYPKRLYKALLNSSTVITAWDNDRLVGLVRLLDDSEMVAYMHYVLVTAGKLLLCALLALCCGFASAYYAAKAGTGFYTKVDLGIAKYHFEIGAGTAQFRWAP